MSVVVCRSMWMEGLQDRKIVTRFMGNLMASEWDILSRRQTAITANIRRNRIDKANPCLFFGPPFTFSFYLMK